MKGLKSLETLLARRNQRFVCTDTGWPEPGAERFTANIVHYPEPPLGNAQLEQLKRIFPDIPELAEFYSHYGSVRLYADPIGGDSAFYIAGPDEWHRLRKYFQAWPDSLNDDEANLLPEWLDDSLTIGEIPTTGNYYLMPTKGDESGKVFLFDHDGFEFVEMGADLGAFVEKITTVNDDLMQSIPGHTRYSDGESETQWLAKEYLYDR